MYQTNDYEGMLAETVTLRGAHGDPVNAYFARPLGPGPFPGVILIHHLPGWDEWYREVTRKFAHHGYAALSPNLYCREGHGTPEDVAAMVRGAGAWRTTRSWTTSRARWRICALCLMSMAKWACSAPAREDATLSSPLVA